MKLKSLIHPGDVVLLAVIGFALGVAATMTGMYWYFLSTIGVLAVFYPYRKTNAEMDNNNGDDSIYDLTNLLYKPRYEPRIQSDDSWRDRVRGITNRKDRAKLP